MSRKPMDVAVMWLVSMALVAGAQAGQPNSLEKQVEHPLLPGVASPEAWNTVRPRAPRQAVDRFLAADLRHGASAEALGRPPAEWRGGSCSVSGGRATARVPLGAGRRVAVHRRLGEHRWRRSNLRLLFHERLHGDGPSRWRSQRQRCGPGGPCLGEVLWSFAFEVTSRCTKCGWPRSTRKFPASRPSFSQHVTTGYLFAFRKNRREPELVRKTQDVAVANRSSPADDGVATIVEPNGCDLDIRHDTINMTTRGPVGC